MSVDKPQEGVFASANAEQQSAGATLLAQSEPIPPTTGHQPSVAEGEALSAGTPEQDASTVASAPLLTQDSLHQPTEPRKSTWVKARPWLEHAVHSMLHDEEPVVGVEIVPGFVRICRMQQTHGRWKLTKLGVSRVGDPAKPPMPVRGHEVEYADALLALLKQANIATTNAGIALPMVGSVVKTLQLPNLSDKEIESAIASGTFWQNFAQVTIKLKDYSIFYEVLRRDEIAKTMDMLFVGARSTEIQLYTSILKQAGLLPVLVDVQCFALQNILAVNHIPSGNQPIAALRCNQDDHYLLIVDNDVPYHYEIFVGEQGNLAEQIQDAEFASRYATQVKQALTKHASKHVHQVRDIYIISPLAETGDFATLLQKSLPDYRISTADIFRHVEVAEDAQAMIAGGVNGVFAVPMGLAVRSLRILDWFHHEEHLDNVNLLAESKAVVASKRKGLLSRLGVSIYLVLAVIICGVLAAMTLQEASRVKKQLAALQTIETEHATKKQLVDTLRSDIKTLDTIEKLHEELPRNQEPLLEVYHAVASTIPQAVWLGKIDYTMPATVLMEGRSMDDAGILEFSHGLNKSGLFRRVSLKAMQAEQPSEEQPVSLKAFTLEGVVKSTELMLPVKSDEEITAEKKKKKGRRGKKDKDKTEEKEAKDKE